jgi:hypothetical protein
MPDMRKSILPGTALTILIVLASFMASTADADPSALEKDKAQIETDKHVLATDREQLEQASKKLQHDRAKMADDERQLQIDKTPAGAPHHFWDKKSTSPANQKPATGEHPLQPPQAPVQEVAPASAPQPAAPAAQ